MYQNTYLYSNGHLGSSSQPYAIDMARVIAVYGQNDGGRHGVVVYVIIDIICHQTGTISRKSFTVVSGLKRVGDGIASIRVHTVKRRVKGYTACLK